MLPFAEPARPSEEPVKVPQTPTPFVLAATVVLIGLFVVLAFVFYGNAEKQVVGQHSRQQLLLARTAGAAIQVKLTQFQFLLAHWAIQIAQEAGSWRSLEAVRKEASLQPFRTVLFLDNRCRPQSLYGAIFIGQADLQRLCGQERPGLGEAIQTSEGLAVALFHAIEIQGQRRGQLVALLPVNILLEPALTPLGPRSSVHAAVLDESGLLLENTRHPEMVGRRIPSELGACGACHQSFEPERQMIAGAEGSVQLQVGSEPQGLVAYAPVAIANHRWAVAVSVPYSEIVEHTRRSFGQILMLVGLFVAVVLVSAVMIINIHRKRVAAEQKALQAERRQQFEQQLLHAEQLAAVGKMTSHIAHEINTPLASIGLNVTYLRNELERHLGARVPEIDEVTEAIASEINRLKKVIGDYLRFSRLHKPMPKARLLEEIVQDFVLFINKEAHERRIEIAADIHPVGRPVWVDENLIRQALLNIVRNSFEAMPDGGRLEIGLGLAQNSIELRLSDNGPGIPPEQRARIFDPFFTTKAEGTGLGLAQTRKIIREHNGEILCRSEVGQGTTFVIRLSLVEGLPETAPRSEKREVEESSYAYKK